MSAGGSIAAMVASMKNNSRRKNKNKPFSNYKKEYKKGQPISSKEMSDQEKNLLLKQLKKNREVQSKQQVYKLILSLLLTIIVISSLVFLIKLIFF